MADAQETRPGRGQRTRRVLMFPLPFQGHINPMLQLADVLHARGLAITVLHTHFNALDPTRRPEFRFVTVPDGIPPEIAASGDIIAAILALNAAMEKDLAATLRAHLASAMSDEPPAACLVIDANVLAVQKAAAQVGLPTLVLRTGSAACFGVFVSYPMLHQNGYLPRQESQLNMPVRELPPLRVRDLFYVSQNKHDMVYKVLARATEAVRNSSGLMVNTFDALEPAELGRIRRELNLPVVLATGPLHKLASKPTGGGSLLRQDTTCIEWLDAQAPESVLYVSFGSIASLGDDEFLEVAWGLARSGQPFLWVVRPGFVRGPRQPELPDEFAREVDWRGKLVGWAPQAEVLSHRAVGGFWTHCGWNSTLESLSEGVPMICRPQFADQMMNARYVEAAWKVGFELDGELERGSVERAVRRLLCEEEGREMRRRAREMKETAARCFESGGSSWLAVDELVRHILSL